MRFGGILRAMVKPLSERDVVGRKFLKRFQSLLSHLRSEAEKECPDPRRKLHFDHYASLLLLYFYSPSVTSLRMLQRVSALKSVQRALGCSRASLGSLSEAASLFDPEILRGAIRELLGEVRSNKSQKLPKGLEGLTAVDGTLIRAVPRMAWALWRRNSEHRAVKVHISFDVLREVPTDVRLTHANAPERAQMRQMLQSGRLYVLDAGYAQYKLFRDIVACGSSFICRIRKDAAWTTIEEREVTEKAKAQGVRRDIVVKLGCWDTEKALEEPVRVVEFLPPRTRRDKDPELMLLATDRLDLDAEVVAVGYRYRWSVELFFRWFKCILGCRKILSHSENGLTIQVYMAIIASLLISVWTGRKPNKVTLEMVSFYLWGMADEEELLAYLQEMPKHSKN